MEERITRTQASPDEELREGAEYIVEQSLLMKEQCEALGLPYYETARERDRVFEHILKAFDPAEGSAGPDTRVIP